MATELSEWLQAQLDERGWNQSALADRAGIGVATVSDTLHKDHIPGAEILLRIAKALDTDRIGVLFTAGLHRVPTYTGEYRRLSDRHHRQDITNIPNGKCRLQAPSRIHRAG